VVVHHRCQIHIAQYFAEVLLAPLRRQGTFFGGGWVDEREWLVLLDAMSTFSGRWKRALLTHEVARPESSTAPKSERLSLWREPPIFFTLRRSRAEHAVFRHTFPMRRQVLAARPVVKRAGCAQYGDVVGTLISALDYSSPAHYL
jgi:hypothetical protein